MSRSIPFPVVAAAAYAALAAQACRLVYSERIPLCPVYFLTGHSCPGCGMGRAVIAAMRGDFAASWSYHPLGLPLFALWTAWLVWGALNLSRGRDFSDGFLPTLRRPAFSWAALAVVFAVYAARFA